MRRGRRGVEDNAMGCPGRASCSVCPKATWSRAGEAGSSGRSRSTEVKWKVTIPNSSVHSSIHFCRSGSLVDQLLPASMAASKYDVGFEARALQISGLTSARVDCLTVHYLGTYPRVGTHVPLDLSRDPSKWLLGLRLVFLLSMPAYLC